MGKLLDVKDNTLSQYETGKREPQLGLLMEIANFFGVSLEYLICKSDIKDYIISDEKSAIDLLTKIDTGEISYDDLSAKTIISLATWIQSNVYNLRDYYPDLYNQVELLFKHITRGNKSLNLYSDMRKKNNEAVNEIIGLLELEEYYGATANQILEFMKQSERISFNDVEKVLENMKNIPDYTED